MKKNKKLLILINDLSFFISHRLPIAEAAITKGFEVVIGYGEAGNSDCKILKKKNIKIKHVPISRGSKNLFKDLKTFIHIWNFFKKEKPDITHLVTIKPYLYGGVIARLMGIPGLVSAISGLGTLFTSNDLKNKFLRLLLYPIFKFAFNHSNQKIIVQNFDDSNLLSEWGVLDLKKVLLIRGSGVKPNKIPDKSFLNEMPVITFASRLIKEKGIYDYIEAASIIKDRGLKAKFYLAGDFDIKNPSGLNSYDLDIIRRKGHVEIIGYKKNIQKLYSISDIVCLPSYREGLPKALLEAAAAAKVIVTTDVPGCRDTVIHKKTGLLVPVKNPLKLADAFQWLIENPKERIKMGKAGREYAKKEFLLEKVVKTHLFLYQELLNKIK